MAASKTKLTWEAIEPRTIRLDGDTVSYRIAGKGPLLLLVHGMAGSAVTWRHVMPELAQRFTVLAPDLLGHGASDKPRGEYSLGAHTDTLRHLLDSLGYKRATFIGQSLGGGVVMQLAYQFPERCERLVLANSGGLGAEVNLILRVLTLPAAEYLFPFFCGPLVRDAASLAGGLLVRAGAQSTPTREEIWRSYASLADARTRTAFFRTLRSVIDSKGQAVSAHHRLYQAARVPTLIVWGADDVLIPVSHAYAAHAAIPGSRLEIFEAVGHYPHCEAPQRFLEVLLDFIGSTKPARLPARTPQRLARLS